MKTGAGSWWRRWKGRPATQPAATPTTGRGPGAHRSDGGFETVYDLFPDIENRRQRASFPDIVEDEFWDVVDRARPHTMLTIEALYDLYHAVRHVTAEGIEGDLVECGAFMGGAALAATEWAGLGGMSNRRFFLYDTFCGFPEGTEPETDPHGNTVKMYSHPNFAAVARASVARSSWPADRFVFVEGDVATTLQSTRPERIALLRLDTDAYSSTRAELERLYPLLTPGGVLIIDDYGLFHGARRATDEFLAGVGSPPLLHRVDSGVRSGIKPAERARRPLS